METSYENFYGAYLKEYHQVRAIYLNKLLSNIPSVNDELKEKEEYADFTKNTQFILQADLRQNYFHCIETFFEFFFAFLPNKGKVPDNTQIVKQIVKSDWSKNYKKIRQIANGNIKLDILDMEIEILGYKISVAHYLFYMGTFNLDKFNEDFRANVKTSTVALKKAIKEFAREFSERGEYNAYKHAMRIFPSFNSIHLLDANTMEEKFKFDISNSVSYQLYKEEDKETIVKTKVCDPKRDYQMTIFCGRMIYSMLALREIVFNPKSRKEGGVMAVRFYNEEEFGTFSEQNVKYQDLEFSTKLL